MSHRPTFRLVPRKQPTQDGPTLFDAAAEAREVVDVELPADEPVTIEARFQRFHDAHPEVYRQLVDLARQARAAGRDRIGMKMLWEAVRWQRFVRPDSTEDWKLNNVYTAHYARLIMAQEPDLADIFETRILRSA